MTRVRSSARSALFVSFVGPLSFLLLRILVFLTPAGNGFAAIGLAFLAWILFLLISFSFGIVALILGGRARRFAKQQGASTITASAAQIIACLDVAPMILSFTSLPSFFHISAFF